MWSILEKGSARTKGWSTLPRVDCTFMTSLEETSSDSDSSSVMDAAQASVPRGDLPRMVLASGHGMGDVASHPLNRSDGAKDPGVAPILGDIYRAFPAFESGWE